MNIELKKLKRLFKKKSKENNFYFPEISNRIINFFSSLYGINCQKVTSSHYSFKCDNICIINDKHIYKFLVMNDFVSLFIIYNYKKVKEINAEVLNMFLTFGQPGEIYTPSEKIFEFLEKRFKSKLRKLKINKVL